MHYYSIYGNDFIFEDWDEFKPEYETILLNDGVFVTVEKTTDNRMRLTGIHSTDPQDYLKNSFNPGTELESRLHFPL